MNIEIIRDKKGRERAYQIVEGKKRPMKVVDAYAELAAQSMFAGSEMVFDNLPPYTETWDYEPSLEIRLQLLEMERNESFMCDLNFGRFQFDLERKIFEPNWWHERLETANGGVWAPFNMLGIFEYLDEINGQQELPFDSGVSTPLNAQLIPDYNNAQLMLPAPMEGLKVAESNEKCRRQTYAVLNEIDNFLAEQGIIADTGTCSEIPGACFLEINGEVVELGQYDVAMTNLLVFLHAYNKPLLLPAPAKEEIGLVVPPYEGFAQAVVQAHNNQIDFLYWAQQQAPNFELERELVDKFTENFILYSAPDLGWSWGDRESAYQQVDDKQLTPCQQQQVDMPLAWVRTHNQMMQEEQLKQAKRKKYARYAFRLMNDAEVAELSLKDLKDLPEQNAKELSERIAGVVFHSYIRKQPTPCQQQQSRAGRWNIKEAVYQYLVKHAQDGVVIGLSQEKIAEDVGAYHATVRSAIRSLVEMNRIQVQQHEEKGNGRGKRLVYKTVFS